MVDTKENYKFDLGVRGLKIWSSKNAFSTSLNLLSLAKFHQLVVGMGGGWGREVQGLLKVIILNS